MGMGLSAWTINANRDAVWINEDVMRFAMDTRTKYCYRGFCGKMYIDELNTMEYEPRTPHSSQAVSTNLIPQISFSMPHPVVQMLRAHSRTGLRPGGAQFRALWLSTFQRVGTRRKVKPSRIDHT